MCGNARIRKRGGKERTWTWRAEIKSFMLARSVIRLERQWRPLVSAAAHTHPAALPAPLSSINTSYCLSVNPLLSYGTHSICIKVAASSIHFFLSLSLFFLLPLLVVLASVPPPCAPPIFHTQPTTNRGRNSYVYLDSIHGTLFLSICLV